MKRAIDDIVQFNPHITFKNTEDVLKFLPTLRVVIHSYNQNDVANWKVINYDPVLKSKQGKESLDLDPPMKYM